MRDIDNVSDVSNELRALKFSLFITFLFAIVEFVGGFLTNSLALISDAGHMVTDSFALFISFLAHYLMVNLKSKKFSYGLYRLEVLAAFINSIFLLGIVAYILFNGINRIINPKTVLGEPMFFISFLGLLVNVFIFFILFKHSKSISIKSALLHVITDALGSIFAIIASVVIIFTKFYQIDPILSIVISLLIIPSTLVLIYQSIDIFLESIPKGINLDKVIEDIKKIDGVINFHDLHIWAINPQNNLLTIHIVKNSDIDNNYILDKVIEVCKQNKIGHVTIQIEDINYKCSQDCDELDHKIYYHKIHYHKIHTHEHRIHNHESDFDNHH